VTTRRKPCEPHPCACPAGCGRIISASLGTRARRLRYHPECGYQDEKRRARDRATAASWEVRKSRAARRAAIADEREKRLALKLASAPQHRGHAGMCDTCSDLPHRIPPGTSCVECNMMSGVHPGDTPEFIRNQALRTTGAIG
jgi:hypothetical protein